MRSRIGGRALLHTAGVAKVIMAFAPESAQDAAIAECGFERYTPTTITSAADLAREWALIRNKGWAVDDREHEDWINCIAVPIFDARGDAVAGLSATAVRAITSLETLQTHLPTILETRDAISLELGWRPTPSTVRS
ncbi:hypothetical protein GCM10025865_12610 [Paraoerskovia sediminicola]|uniref:IclR-ED domain-containing protein n=2 Tax=Paraoerskovia sediminicola TaxID=1138587 RepID=A0ABM8G1J5_9CELL|nr:IclR family transcriptional regulator C-terminal domain-containing protein [Paraoerskovia sediminicola]BDZ41962.1 hypothetical protein GCM10025865_12610 [Paraoerskovia sediminicola]